MYTWEKKTSHLACQVREVLIGLSKITRQAQIVIVGRDITARLCNKWNRDRTTSRGTCLASLNSDAGFVNSKDLV